MIDFIETVSKRRNTNYKRFEFETFAKIVSILKQLQKRMKQLSVYLYIFNAKLPFQIAKLL